MRSRSRFRRLKGVDVYLFAGPSMREAVQRYNLFAGGGLVPPEWGLGFWYRAEQHDDSDSLRKLASEFRDRKIPCDVIGLEPGWQTHAYSCSFAWDSARFPAAEGFCERSLGPGIPGQPVGARFYPSFFTPF